MPRLLDLERDTYGLWGALFVKKSSNTLLGCALWFWRLRFVFSSVRNVIPFPQKRRAWISDPFAWKITKRSACLSLWKKAKNTTNPNFFGCRAILIYDVYHNETVSCRKRNIAVMRTTGGRIVLAESVLDFMIEWNGRGSSDENCLSRIRVQKRGHRI